MSDSAKGLTVFFKKPVHEDYASKLCEAILLFDGVEKVVPSIIKPDYYFALAEAKAELRDKILDIILERK